MDPVEPGMVDATDFLAFTTRLRDLRDRVEEARVSDEQRRRWQRRLATISGVGADDLARASAQLNRFEADVARVIGD